MLMNLRGYDSPRYPEGPMTIAAIAQLLSSITGGIGDWQERKQRKGEFEQQMTMRESLQDWQEEKYRGEQRIGEMGRETEAERWAETQDVAAETRSYEREQDALARAGETERWEKDYGLRQEMLEHQKTQAGDRPGDPMKMLGQIQDVFGGFRKMTETGDVDPQDIARELETMVDVSNSAPALRMFMEEAVDAPTKSHVSYLANQMREMLPEAYEQQIIKQIEQYVWEHGSMPVSEGPTPEDVAAIEREAAGPTQPWQQAGRDVYKGLEYLSPVTWGKGYMDLFGDQERQRKFLALIGGMAGR
jgi:hypothetical protein